MLTDIGSIGDQILKEVQNEFQNKRDTDIGLWIFIFQEDVQTLNHWYIILPDSIKPIDSNLRDLCRKSSILFGEGSIGYSVVSGSAVVIEDTQADPRGVVSLIDHRIGQYSALCYPLVDEESDHLACVLDFFHRDKNYFNELDKEDVKKVVHKYKEHLILIHKLEHNARFQKLLTQRSQTLLQEPDDVVSEVGRLLSPIWPVSVVSFNEEEKGQYYLKDLYINIEFLKNKLLRDIRWCSYKSAGCIECCFLPRIFNRTGGICDDKCMLKEILFDDSTNWCSLKVDDENTLWYYHKEKNFQGVGLLKNVLSRNIGLAKKTYGESKYEKRKNVGEAIALLLENLIEGERLSDVGDLSNQSRISFEVTEEEWNSIYEIREGIISMLLLTDVPEGDGFTWNPEKHRAFQQCDELELFKLYSTIQPLYHSLSDNTILDRYPPTATCFSIDMNFVSELSSPAIHINYDKESIVWQWQQERHWTIFYIFLASDFLSKKLTDKCKSWYKFEIPRFCELMEIDCESGNIFPTDRQNEEGYNFIVYPHRKVSRSAKTEGDSKTKSNNEIINALVRGIYNQYKREKERIKALNYALFSAIAAIMARNMSHLLGSHIEPGIQNDIESFMFQSMESSLLNLSDDLRNDLRNDLQSLDNFITVPEERRSELSHIVKSKEEALKRYSIYRQRRMDFIARIAVEWSSWGVGFDFYRHLVFPFMSNSILLHFMGYSDGFTIENIDFLVEMEGEPVKEYCDRLNKYLKPIDLIPALGIVDKNTRDPKWPTRSETNNGYQPSILWCRGGDMGVQAFHIILENIARNSIKHSDRLAQDRNFRLGIFLFNNRIELKKRFKSSKDLRLKETEDQVYVVLSSNADTGDAKRCSAMDGWLRGPVITSTGERDPEGWGMKEMKLAAAFLANRGVDACNDERPVYIQAGTYEWKDDDCHLAYCLVVPKYHYVGVLRNE